jgi:predicted DNA-binding transcriptional regulator AlpA
MTVKCEPSTPKARIKDRVLPANKFRSTTRIPALPDPASGASNLAPQPQPDHPAAAKPAAIDPLLSDRDLERLTGGKRSTWQKRRLSGNGPPFIKLGRLVRYRRSQFEAWLAAIPSLQSTSDNGPAASGGRQA